RFSNHRSGRCQFPPRPTVSLPPPPRLCLQLSALSCRFGQKPSRLGPRIVEKSLSLSLTGRLRLGNCLLGVPSRQLTQLLRGARRGHERLADHPLRLDALPGRPSSVFRLEPVELLGEPVSLGDGRVQLVGGFFEQFARRLDAVPPESAWKLSASQI